MGSPEQANGSQEHREDAPTTVDFLAAPRSSDEFFEQYVRPNLGESAIRPFPSQWLKPEVRAQTAEAIAAYNAAVSSGNVEQIRAAQQRVENAYDARTRDGFNYITSSVDRNTFTTAIESAFKADHEEAHAILLQSIIDEINPEEGASDLLRVPGTGRFANRPVLRARKVQVLIDKLKIFDDMPTMVEDGVGLTPEQTHVVAVIKERLELMLRADPMATYRNEQIERHRKHMGKLGAPVRMLVAVGAGFFLGISAIMDLNESRKSGTLHVSMPTLLYAGLLGGLLKGLPDSQAERLVHNLTVMQSEEWKRLEGAYNTKFVGDDWATTIADLRESDLRRKIENIGELDRHDETITLETIHRDHFNNLRNNVSHTVIRNMSAEDLQSLTRMANHPSGKDAVAAMDAIIRRGGNITV